MVGEFSQILFEMSFMRQ